MQLLSDEPGAIPSAPPTPRTQPRPSTGSPGLLAGALVLGLAAAGGGVGYVVGSNAPATYRTTVAVEVEQVLSFDPWEANLQTARFGQAVLRTDLHEAAAASAGIEASDYAEIESDQIENSPIVMVSAVTDRREGAGPAISALVDATLLDLVASDEKPQQLIIDEVRPSLESAEAERAALWEEAEVAPGSNLTDIYNQAQYNLETATAEQAVATEQWRIDQLPGIIALAERQITTVEPLLDRWYDVTTRIAALEARVTPATAKLEELRLGRQVVEAGSHLSEPVVEELPASTQALRAAAAGAAGGIAVALLALALVSLFGARRRS